MESKCSKKLEDLEETMMKHPININSYFNSSSHGHALYAFVFSFNVASSSHSHDCLDEIFTSDEAILKAMSGLYGP